MSTITRNLAILAGFSLPAYFTAAHADQTVLIGHAAPLTGGMAQHGKDTESGALLAIEEINAKGLVVANQKITLKLDSQDDAGDPRTATQVAQKLVDEGIVGVVGHLNSGTSIAASKIYSDANVVEISPSATNPAYTLQGFRSTFRLVGTDAQQGPALARFAANELKIKKVAVVDDSTAYGQGLANEFEKTAKALGLTVISHEATNDKAVDFRAVLTKIKSESPDAIMYGGMDATGGPFAKQAQQLGLKAKVLGGDGLCTPTMTLLAGAAVENVYCTEPGVPLEKMSQGERFSQSFQKRFNHPIDLYAPYAYDAVYIIVDAMKRANSTNPEKILAAMKNTGYQGVTGPIAFDSKGDLKQGAISVYTFRNKQMNVLSVQKM
ncbi:branched-chain amino acid ABC transporter substrate-binding protein [Paraburkholderia agricolaris]|uniref:branched-chain amino acid ABC transporter substrate-binding protein n=1 Tax=Paraburkholderia agricolaris TaxID=2152888 RepID=UPI0038BCEEAC